MSYHTIIHALSTAKYYQLDYIMNTLIPTQIDELGGFSNNSNKINRDLETSTLHMTTPFKGLEITFCSSTKMKMN